MSKITKSEILFVEILDSLDIYCEKIPETNKSKTSDFKVGKKNTSYWELKGLNENDNEKSIIKNVENGVLKSYSIDSKRVVNSIKNSKGQLKKYSNLGNPCILVLSDDRDFITKDLFFTDKIKSLLLGNRHYQENEKGELVEIYKELSMFTNRKKYISAIAIMYHDSKEIIIYHNPYTDISLVGSSILEKFPNQYKVEKNEIGHYWEKVT